MDDRIHLLDEHICPICKKSFYMHCTPTEYVYKIRHKDSKSTYFYCSYSCFRKAENKLKSHDYSIDWDDLLVLIIGESGSGKTSLVQELKKRFRKDIKELVSYTTRAKRSEDEKGHLFVTENDYQQAFANGTIAAYTIFDKNRYWATEQQLQESNVYVIDLAGAKQVKEYLKTHDLVNQKTGKKKKLITVFIDSPEDVRFYRMRTERGDLFSKVKERIEHDRIAFKGAKEFCDIVVPHKGNSINVFVDNFCKTLAEELL